MRGVELSKTKVTAMTTIYSHEHIAELLARGRAERARVLAELTAGGGRKVAGAVKALRAWFVRRAERARVTRELRAMDPRMLADIGLTVGEIDLVASGKLTRGSLRRPALQAANESVAPAGRVSPKAA